MAQCVVDGGVLGPDGAGFGGVGAGLLGCCGVWVGVVGGAGFGVVAMFAYSFVVVQVPWTGHC